MTTGSKMLLPKGWAAIELGQIADVQLGKMLDKKRTEGTPLRYLRNINVRWGHIDISDLLEMPFGEQELDRYGLVPGDVLVCEGGEPGRASVWLLNEPTIKYQKALHRVRMYGGSLPRWVVHHLYFDAQRGQLSRHFTGTTIKHFPRESIREYVVRLPPLREQTRIVEAIESYFTRLDDAVATLERVQRSLERYRASVLKAAVEGRLVPTEAELARAEGRDYEPASVLLERILAERRRRWEEAELAKMRTKGKAPRDDKWKEKYKESVAPGPDLPALPAGWCWATVDQLSCEVRYGSSAKSSSRLAPGIPVLRMGNIAKGTLDFGDLKYLRPDHEEFPDLLLEPGDLLFNRTNSAELVGKTAVFHGHTGPCSFASYLIRVRFSPGIEPDFVAHYINSVAGRAWIASVVSQQVGQANVNGTKLKACCLPLPPVNEQARIVAESDRLMSMASQLVVGVEVGRVRSQRLRQAILKWAFEGRLVDQKPTDEPASVLLERIKTEREAAGAAKKAKRKPRRRKKESSA